MHGTRAAAAPLRTQLSASSCHGRFFVTFRHFPCHTPPTACPCLLLSAAADAYVWRLVNGLWSLLLAAGLLLGALAVVRARSWRFLSKVRAGGVARIFGKAVQNAGGVAVHANGLCET